MICHECGKTDAPTGLACASCHEAFVAQRDQSRREYLAFARRAGIEVLVNGQRPEWADDAGMSPK